MAQEKPIIIEVDKPRLSSDSFLEEESKQLDNQGKRAALRLRYAYAIGFFILIIAELGFIAWFIQAQYKLLTGVHIATISVAVIAQSFGIVAIISKGLFGNDEKMKDQSNSDSSLK